MIDFTDRDRDLSTDRVYELDNNKLRYRKTDPYGFWVISFERGQVPEHLRGNYTSAAAAEAAITRYLAEKKREAKPAK